MANLNNCNTVFKNKSLRKYKKINLQNAALNQSLLTIEIKSL